MFTLLSTLALLAATSDVNTTDDKSIQPCPDGWEIGTADGTDGWEIGSVCKDKDGVIWTHDGYSWVPDAYTWSTDAYTW